MFHRNKTVTRVALRGEVSRRCEGVDTKCYNKVTMVVVMNLLGNDPGDDDDHNDKTDDEDGENVGDGE